MHVLGEMGEVEKTYC